MNNQRRAIYAERRRVLEGQDLKEQVRRKTMDEIVEYYVNPDLPSEEWDTLVSKVKFVYLLSDLEPSQIGLSQSKPCMSADCLRLESAD